MTIPPDIAAVRDRLIAATANLKARFLEGRRRDDGSRRRPDRLAATRRPVSSVPVALADELAGLPAPARRWLEQVLTDGQPRIQAVTVRHAGRFNTSEEGQRWRRFRSEQHVVIEHPGFHWDARIAYMPGLAVHVHDAYIGGRGLLRAVIGGLVKVVDLEGGGELARGELMRWAAEAAWYPTALLPGGHVQWSAIDGDAAGLTATDGPNQVDLTVRFDARGLIHSVRADDRPRLVRGEPVPTPWQGRFWNYRTIDGMRDPLDAEAAWLLPGGPQPYWRGHIETIDYEFTR